MTTNKIVLGAQSCKNQGSIKHFGSSMQNFDTSLLTRYKAMKYVDFLN